MKAPSRTDRALARRGSAKAFGCLTALAIYGAATGQVPWIMPVILGVLTVASRKATAEVGSYDRWTGEWKSLLRPERNRQTVRRRGSPLKAGRMLGFTLFVLGGVWLVASAQQSGVALGPSLLGVFALALAGRFVMRRIPGLRLLTGARPAPRSREFTVAICPSLPMRAPRPNVAGLPPYCRALLLPSPARLRQTRANPASEFTN